MARCFFPQDQIWNTMDEMNLKLERFGHKWALTYEIKGVVGKHPMDDSEDTDEDGNVLEEPPVEAMEVVAGIVDDLMNPKRGRR